MDATHNFLDVSEEGSKHAYFMKQALLMVRIIELPRCALFELSKLTIHQGEKALQANETPVGCVLVYDGQIVGSGMNDTNKSMNVSSPGYIMNMLI